MSMDSVHLLFNELRIRILQGRGDEDPEFLEKCRHALQILKANQPNPQRIDELLKVKQENDLKIQFAMQECDQIREFILNSLPSL
jgi:phosphoribosylanthranilate isomerase